MSERENLQEAARPFFVVELITVSNVDNLWVNGSHQQHECVKGMEVAPSQYLGVHSTGSINGRGKKCWGERYFSWPSYAGLRWGWGWVRGGAGTGFIFGCFEGEVSNEGRSEEDMFF